MKNTHTPFAYIPDAMPKVMDADRLNNACRRWLEDREAGRGPVRPSTIKFTPHTEAQKEAWRNRVPSGEVQKGHGFCWKRRKTA